MHKRKEIKNEFSSVRSLMYRFSLLHEDYSPNDYQNE